MDDFNGEENKKHGGHRLYLLYEKKIIECRKARQRCEELRKQQAQILFDMNKFNQELLDKMQDNKVNLQASYKENFDEIYNLFNRYFKLNQKVLTALSKILTELSNVSFESKKSDTIIITLLQSLLQAILNNKLNEEYSLQEFLEKLLQQKEPQPYPPININAGGDANLNNAGRDVSSKSERGNRSDR